MARELRFLVLGSNAFSGAHFVRYLLEHGIAVLGASRSAEPNSVFLPYRWLPLAQQAGFRFERIDLNYDLPRLMEVIQDWRPSHIVNFAAQGMVAQSWETPEHWYQTNVVAQVCLHDRLRHLDFLERYVHVTTPEVYGSTDGWVKESVHFAPSTPYAVSRAACDLHLMSFFNAYRFPVVFTRAANVYGPGQQLYRIIPRALLSARTGQRLWLHGGGQSVRSFIHIQDVAEATFRIALGGEPGAAYHISTRESLSIRDLVARIANMTGVGFEQLVEYGEERLGKDQAYLLDSSRLRDTLGWQDSIDLEAGLAETLEWIDSRIVDLQNLPLDYQHKP